MNSTQHISKKTYPILSGCNAAINPTFSDFYKTEIAKMLVCAASAATAILYPAKNIIVYVEKFDFKEVIKDLSEIEAGTYCILFGIHYCIIKCIDENGEKLFQGIDCTAENVLTCFFINTGFYSLDADLKAGTVMNYNEGVALFSTIIEGQPFFFYALALLVFYSQIPVSKLLLKQRQSKGKLFGKKYSSDIGRDVTVFDIKL